MAEHAELIERLRGGIRESNLTLDMTEKLMEIAADALEAAEALLREAETGLERIAFGGDAIFLRDTARSLLARIKEATNG